MTLPESSRLQFTPDLNICRVLNGMWQVSGAHGRIDRKAAIQNMSVSADRCLRRCISALILNYGIVFETGYTKAYSGTNVLLYN